MSLTIKILGSGCANCKRLEKQARDTLDDAALPYTLEKVTDFADIATYGVMSTPGLVINDVVYAAGRVPKRDEIIKWAQAAE